MPLGQVPPGFRGDLPRWQQLVSVHWLAALVAQRPLPAAPLADWHLLEVGCDGLADFHSGHIAPARYLDTRQCEALPFWNARPAPALQRVLHNLGIGPLSCVILYGRNTLAAARVALLLLAAGVGDVRLLDGGLPAWQQAGLGLHAGGAAAPVRAARPCAADPAPWPAAYNAYLLDTAAARALRGRPDAALVSIRSRAENLGQHSGYAYIPARGESAGALWGHAGADGDVNSMADFQDALGCMRPAAEISRMWARAGIVPALEIGFYCGTGWRAALAFFYAWLMGWPRIGVYDGGWFEWSSDPANPVSCRTGAAPLRPQSDPAPQSLPT